VTRKECDAIAEGIILIDAAYLESVDAVQ